MSFRYFGDQALVPFAHRGGAQRWPENTLLAFHGAYDLGYRWIETDVQLSRDGELVVFHDLTLERTTNGTGPVANLDLSQLRNLDAAYHFTRDGRSHPYRSRGITIPTLEAALDLASDLHFNLEMKGNDTHLPDRVFDFIEAHGVHDRVLVASANDDLTERFRHRASGRVATSPGAKGIFRFWLAAKAGLHKRLSIPYQALQVPRKHGALTVVDRTFIEAAHECDVKVHLWTINSPSEMRYLSELGVDGIMTDRPEVLLDSLEDKLGSPPRHFASLLDDTDLSAG